MGCFYSSLEVLWQRKAFHDEEKSDGGPPVFFEGTINRSVVSPHEIFGNFGSIGMVERYVLALYRKLPLHKLHRGMEMFQVQGDPLEIERYLDSVVARIGGHPALIFIQDLANMRTKLLLKFQKPSRVQTEEALRPL